MDLQGHNLKELRRVYYPGAIIGRELQDVILDSGSSPWILVFEDRYMVLEVSNYPDGEPYISTRIPLE